MAAIEFDMTTSMKKHCDVSLTKHYTVMHSFEEIEPEKKQWDALALSCNADIYQTFDWCRIWWRHYGNQRKLHLIVCRTNNQWDGILVMFSETLGVKPLNYHVVKQVGGDHTLQTCIPLVKPGTLRDILAFSTEYFLIGCNFNLVHIGPLPSEEFENKYWQSAISHSRNQFSHCILPCTEVVWFNLPRTKNEYFESIGRKKLNEYKRNWEKGVSERKFTSDIIDSEGAVINEFEHFVDLHQDQWQNLGRCGHFGDWPQSIEFNRDLVKVFGKLGQVRFHRIVSDGVVISSQFAFNYGNKLHWRLPARSSDLALSALGVGKLALIKMIEYEISHGTHTIEAGQGHYPYKEQLGGIPISMSHISICKNSRLSKLLMNLTFLASRVINNLYYRIWYLKLSHKFLVLRRPLWSTWIRTSF